MKIDSHQHYWRYSQTDFPWVSDQMPKLKRDCLPIDVADARLQIGIDGVVAVQARTTPDETEYLLQLGKNHSEIWGVVGWANLREAQAQSNLERWGDQTLFKGIRHILQDEANVTAWVDDIQVNLNLQALQRQELVYDVLVFERQMAEVVDFCARHDQHWLVLDHVGKPSIRNWGAGLEGINNWKKQLQSLAALPHLMCKLSGLVTETAWNEGRFLSSTDKQNMVACFETALETFGADRLMFGSDWPVCQLAEDIEGVHALTQAWVSSSLSANEQAAFWSGNAIRCYNLKPCEKEYRRHGLKA